MDFGIIFANAGPMADPDLAAGFAQLAESNGFESLWTVEHVAVPAGYQSEYPYSRDGRMPGPEDLAIPDPLIWLTWVAAATVHLKLATGILILPQRNPVVLAKQVATLDVLSDGRVILGVGVGWLREEFEALGIPWDRRGARTDEYIGALRSLWGTGPSTFEGEFAEWRDLHVAPKPVQEGGVPVVIGGHTEAAARRAGRIGDGFFPGKGDIPHLISVMRDAATEAGRDPDAIEITTGPGMTVEQVQGLADLGVHRTVIAPLAYDLEGLKRQLGTFADEVISKV